MLNVLFLNCFVQRGTPVCEAMDCDTNQPHVIRFVDEDLPTQYCIAVEQVVHLDVSSIVKGIFVIISLHYIYDIHYHPRVLDFLLFFEDKILNIKVPSTKKSAIYSNVSSAIECYISK